MKQIQVISLIAVGLVIAGTGRADEKSAIAKIESLGGRVLYIAKDSKEYSVTIVKNSFGGEKNFEAADAKVLAELRNSVEIAFQHPAAADDWVTPLKGLTGLKKLHLEKTKVTDKALDTLAGLTNLEYLNLYKTGVTDAGLDKLKKLKNLKSLYLWQTKVTVGKAKAFQEAMAKAGNKDLAINLGVDKDLRSVNTIARLKTQRAASTKVAKEAAEKAAKAEAAKYAAIKEPKYDKDILPIFKQNCVKCHGKEKPKGKFRLDTFAELQKGADGEPVIVAKKPEESSIYELIILPIGNDDRMPKKGDGLSKPVTDLVRRWIEQGGLQK
jgi:mono/diheme cytochrome c family protein